VFFEVDNSDKYYLFWSVPALDMRFNESKTPFLGLVFKNSHINLKGLAIASYRYGY